MKKMNVNVVQSESGSVVKEEAVLFGGILLGAVVLVALMFFGTTTVLATEIRVENFRDNWSANFSDAQDFRMNFGDNLLVRVGGVDMSVVAAGYGAGSWHLGLTTDDGTVVGWATNSSKGSPGYEGWLTGEYSSLMGYGNRPTHAYLVYDSADTGPTHGWDIVDGVVGSALDKLEDDLFFDETDISFDGVLGGISALPGYAYEDRIAPEMTVVIPEPATITVLALGGLSLIRKRRSIK